MMYKQQLVLTQDFRSSRFTGSEKHGTQITKGTFESNFWLQNQKQTV